MLKRTIVFFSILSLLALPTTSFAEEQSNNEAGNTTVTVTQEPDITAQDLGLSEPIVLPGSVLYPFKKLGEKIQELLTFQPEAKARLEMKLANKRLLEARKLIKAGKDAEAIKILENYQIRMDDAKKKLESIDASKLNEEQKAKLKETEGIFTENFFKHIAVLERVEGQVPDSAKDTIARVIEKEKEKIAERISKLNPQDASKAKEELDKILNQLPGDEVEKIEYLKTLREIKDKLSPELKGKIDILEKERIQKIGDYIKQNKPTAEEQKKLLENLSKKIEKTKDKMADFQNKILKELPQNIQAQYQEIKKMIQQNQSQKDGSLEILK